MKTFTELGEIILKSRGDSYSGKGKRTGVKGHYKYKYTEDSKREKKTAACGMCFPYANMRKDVDAAGAAGEHDDDRVVHGKIKGLSGPHGWVERADGTVMDWQTEQGVWYHEHGLGKEEYMKTGWPKDEFYATFKPSGVKKYTTNAAMVNSFQNKNYGPWTKDEERKPPASVSKSIAKGDTYSGKGKRTGVKGHYEYKYDEGSGRERRAIPDKEKPKGITKKERDKLVKKYKNEGLDKIPPVGVTDLIDHGATAEDIHSGAVMTWRAPNGDKRHAYTSTFMDRNAANKWNRVRQLNDKVPAAQRKLRKFMNDSSQPQTARDTAAALLIISQTGLRAGHGGQAHVRKHGTKGVMTLHTGDVKANTKTGEVSFSFTGKSKKHNTSSLKDKDLAKYIAQSKKGRGDAPLWRRTLSGEGLSLMMGKVGLSGFKPKDFRTNVAAEKAAEFLAQRDSPPPKTKKEVVKIVNECAIFVSDALNNTPAVTKKSYIPPSIFDSWHNQIEVIAKATTQSILEAALAKPAKGAGNAEPAKDDDSESLEQFDLPEWFLEMSGELTKAIPLLEQLAEDIILKRISVESAMTRIASPKQQRELLTLVQQRYSKYHGSSPMKQIGKSLGNGEAMSFTDLGNLIIKAKSGEGSKGGNVVGHTASGNPIYAPKNGKVHSQSSFEKLEGHSKEDHADFIDIHMNESNKHHKAQKTMKDGADRDNARELRDAHYAAASSHHNELHGGRKMGEKPSSKRSGGVPVKKGGEGSRGGKIIGHTASGKPIYEDHSHPVPTQRHKYKDSGDTEHNHPTLRGEGGHGRSHYSINKDRDGTHSVRFSHNGKSSSVDGLKSRDHAHAVMAHHAKETEGKKSYLDYENYNTKTREPGKNSLYRYKVKETQKSLTLKNILMKALTNKSDSLSKGGPYRGPRGGMWADAQHTIPWKESEGRGRSMRSEKTSSRHEERRGNQGPKNSNWSGFAHKLDIGTLDLDNIANDMGFEDFQHMDISINPRNLSSPRRKHRQKKFLAAVREHSTKAEKMSDAEILGAAGHGKPAHVGVTATSGGMTVHAKTGGAVEGRSSRTKKSMSFTDLGDLITKARTKKYISRTKKKSGKGWDYKYKDDAKTGSKKEKVDHKEEMDRNYDLAAIAGNMVEERPHEKKHWMGKVKEHRDAGDAHRRAHETESGSSSNTLDRWDFRERAVDHSNKMSAARKSENFKLEDAHEDARTAAGFAAKVLENYGNKFSSEIQSKAIERSNKLSKIANKKDLKAHAEYRKQVIGNLDKKELERVKGLIDLKNPNVAKKSEWLQDRADRESEDDFVFHVNAFQVPSFRLPDTAPEFEIDEHEYINLGIRNLYKELKGVEKSTMSMTDLLSKARVKKYISRTKKKTGKGWDYKYKDSKGGKKQSKKALYEEDDTDPSSARGASAMGIDRAFTQELEDFLKENIHHEDSDFDVNDKQFVDGLRFALAWNGGGKPDPKKVDEGIARGWANEIGDFKDEFIAKYEKEGLDPKDPRVEEGISNALKSLAISDLSSVLESPKGKAEKKQPELIPKDFRPTFSNVEDHTNYMGYLGGNYEELSEEDFGTPQELVTSKFLFKVSAALAKKHRDTDVEKLIIKELIPRLKIGVGRDDLAGDLLESLHWLSKKPTKGKASKTESKYRSDKSVSRKAKDGDWDYHAEQAEAVMNQIAYAGISFSSLDSKDLKDAFKQVTGHTPSKEALQNLVFAVEEEVEED